MCTTEKRHDPAERAVPFGANAIRLTGRQWIVASALVLALCMAVPAIWPYVERHDPGADYRIPYVLGNDYWHYARHAKQAAGDDRVLVVGDSVVWGEYAAPDDTLAQHLNQQAGQTSFLNLGVNGIHPAAMGGLLTYYGRALEGQRILLHYNPLWMSSLRHDLQSQKETPFNHPKLVPQFSTVIPCYKVSKVDRVGIVAERYLPFRAWTNHLAVAYFGDTNLASWAVENPYQNPFGQITGRLPEPRNELRHDPAPWHERGIVPANFEWVDADTSLQWRLFRETVAMLQSRGNGLFVLIGPFNEHMLEEESRSAYRDLKSQLAAWFAENNIPHWAPGALPSNLYGDASHPLGAGYALLAEELAQDEGFRRFINGVRS